MKTNQDIDSILDEANVPGYTTHFNSLYDRVKWLISVYEYGKQREYWIEENLGIRVCHNKIYKIIVIDYNKEKLLKFIEYMENEYE